MRGGHFFASAGLHGVAQGALHFIYFSFILGAQVHFHRGTRGDGIHRSAAFDHAEIVGTPGIIGNRKRRKFHNTAGKRGDGIGRAEIGPAVSAGAGNGDFEAVRGDTLRGDVFSRSAVHRDHCCEARAVRFHQGANAAQIAFAFFADIACEDDRFGGLDARFGKRARDACQRSEACAVVSNARSCEAIAVAFHADVCAGGKNCVEMRGKQDDAVRVCAGAFGDYVAGFVNLNV